MNRVEFLDGSKVLYTYDAKGTKLRTEYCINLSIARKSCENLNMLFTVPQRSLL